MKYQLVAEFKYFQSLEKLPVVSFSFKLLIKSDSKNCMFQLFQKPQRTIGFHKRTNKEMVVIWVVDNLTGTADIFKNWIFGFFEDRGYELHQLPRYPVEVWCSL